MTALGIHDLSVATTHHVLELDDLAARNGVDPQKYRMGLGQAQMSVPAPDEDVVTMGAAAALPIIERHGTDRIRTLLFATETGVDNSKAAGVFVHSLLGLPAAVRTVELKQACYSGTAALQTALGIVARNPSEQVLVITADIARYELDSAAEPTQGAAAVAMLVSADPTLLALETASGVHTADIDDFWRPLDSTTAVVDGALSTRAYMDAVLGAWDDYRAHGGAEFADIDHFVYHQPFTKMARKAHARLAQHNGAESVPEAFESTFTYNIQLGNSYTASMYAGLAALLDSDDDLTGKRIGLLSYGSGSVGEVLSGIVQPGYREHVRAEQTRAALENRQRIALEDYRALHAAVDGSSTDQEFPQVTAAPFRLAGIRGHARHYESTRSA